jgi:hypothetical protein
LKLIRVYRKNLFPFVGKVPVYVKASYRFYRRLYKELDGFYVVNKVLVNNIAIASFFANLLTSVVIVIIMNLAVDMQNIESLNKVPDEVF